MRQEPDMRHSRMEASGTAEGRSAVSLFFFFSSRRRHTRFDCDCSSDVCSSDLDETSEGKSAAYAAKALFDAGADIVGMNCLRPPEHLLRPMQEMRKAVSGYLACQPVAYRTPKESPDFTSLPEFPTALDPLQLTRTEMGEYATHARQIGINYIGACCGAVASHIREMARALGKVPVDTRVWKKEVGKPMSAYEYYGHGQMAETKT